MTLGDAAEPLVHIKDLRMGFGDKTVSKDLSLVVPAVETFGFPGSNGSGKTTTLRALLGIYKPTAGTLYPRGLGTLTCVEAAIFIAELFIVGILILRLAVRLFRYGTIEYGRKLSIAGTFRHKELAAK
jgi:ABC-type transport system involved in cytochrome bd biosynthesis fused ATPase/permease subunit